MKNLNIPVGISDFEKIRNDKFYYLNLFFIKKERYTVLKSQIKNLTIESQYISRDISFSVLSSTLSASL